MGSVASFHLVRYPVIQTPRALAAMGNDRLRLSRVPGLQFWRLLGTGSGSSTAPGADLRRWALFAVWEDEVDLERFLAGSAIARRWARHSEEAWHVRLGSIGGHGSWRRFDVIGNCPLIDPRPTRSDGEADVGADGVVAVITRAVVKRDSWRRFASAGPAVSGALQNADGLLAVVGIGEAPIGRQATFSLWRSARDIENYAYRSPEHADIVRRTRQEGWYGEELFARFASLSSSGTWEGRNPLEFSSDDPPASVAEPL